MAELRVRVKDMVVYEGPLEAVPRVGEEIRHNNETVRVEAVVWDFGSGGVSVTVQTGDRPYTF